MPSHSESFNLANYRLRALVTRQKSHMSTLRCSARAPCRHGSAELSYGSRVPLILRSVPTIEGVPRPSDPSDFALQTISPRYCETLDTTSTFARRS